jgi:hypothetical protein
MDQTLTLSTNSQASSKGGKFFREKDKNKQPQLRTPPETSLHKLQSAWLAALPAKSKAFAVTVAVASTLQLVGTLNGVESLRGVTAVVMSALASTPFEIQVSNMYLSMNQPPVTTTTHAPKVPATFISHKNKKNESSYVILKFV